MSKLLTRSIAALCTGISISITAFALSPTPAAPQSNPVAITGVTVHVGDGSVISQGTVTFSDGKITGVFQGTDTPDLAGHEVLNHSGEHLYPGFILPNTRLGLVEVNNVRGTVDDRERGGLNASVRSLVAYNTDSETIPTYRFNGVLTAQVTPKGGLLAGNSSVVQLDAWNWEDASIKSDDAMHVYWPRQLKPKVDVLRQKLDFEKDDKYQGHIDSLTELFTDAKVGGVDVNLKLNAVARVLEGDAQLFIHVERAREIVDALNFARDMEVPRVVLVGAREALQVKDLVLERQVPIIVQHVLGLPSTVDSAIDENFSRPALFKAAGFKIGLAAKSRMEPASGRNLPFIAGTAAGYGLSSEEAVALITSGNAEILGIADELGTIETGKRATLFISIGDALDMRTNQVRGAYIDGRAVEIRGTQQELFDRFKEKYSN
jgi:imidazolonepropionase-like amidohydrolase